MHRRKRVGRRPRWPFRMGWITLCLLVLAGSSESFGSSDSLSELRLVGYGGAGAYPQAASGAGSMAPEAGGGASK
jgi:hypothetical protein